MENRDKEEFEKWLKINIKNSSISDVGKVFFITDFSKVWQAACEYKNKEYSNLMDAMIQTSRNNKEEFEKRLDVVCDKENDYERFFAIWQVAVEYKQEEIEDLRSMLKSSIFVYEEQKKRLVERLNEATKIIEEMAYDCEYELPIDMIEKAKNFLKE